MVFSSAFPNIAEISKFLEGNEISVALFSAVTLGVAAIKFLKDLWKLYEEKIQNRKFKKILTLCDETQEGTTISQYLKTLKSIETFRIASGIESSLEQSEMLMRLFNHGFVTPSELKMIHRFLRPDGRKIQIKVTLSDRILFIGSFVMMLYFLFSGIALGFFLFFALSGLKSLIGLLILGLLVFGGIIIGRGHRPYPLIKEIKIKLEEKKMLSDLSHIA